MASQAPRVVLLVEDNANHAELVVRCVGHLGVACQVVHVTDGEAALAYLFRRGAYADPRSSPRPHLVLLDLRLPRIDGLDVLTEIKTAQELCEIPVLVITSSTDGQDITGALERRADGYLVKPVDPDEFARVLDDLGFCESLRIAGDQ